jgi:hypothetical protein
MSQKLDQSVIDRLSQPIYQTWGVLQEDAGELRIRSNAAAMELVLDADRIQSYPANNAEANQLVRDLCAEHGYKQVSKFLCKHIKLLD